jgi:hypothetical protein
MKNMSRLETINSLKVAEERKESFKALLNDVGDYYTKNVSITVQFNTAMHTYRQEYDGYPVDVNKVAFLGYIKQEIASLEEHITKLIGDLSND